MTQEELDQWVSKLRDPSLKQAKGRLVRVDDDGVSYCCLGVFTEYVKGCERGASGSGYGYIHPGTGETMLSLTMSAYIPDERQGVLAALNDGNVNAFGFNPSGQSRTFAEIADFLESKGLDWINDEAVVPGDNPPFWPVSND